MFSSPSTPKPPPVITGETAESVQGSRQSLRRRLQSLYGRRATILTGGQGSTNNGASAPTLLGS